MTITEISFGKTVNTGNYESVRLDFTARIEEGETPQDVYAKLREIVEKCADGEKQRAKANR